MRWALLEALIVSNIEMNFNESGQPAQIIDRFYFCQLKEYSQGDPGLVPPAPKLAEFPSYLFLPFSLTFCTAILLQHEGMQAFDDTMA